MLLHCASLVLTNDPYYKSLPPRKVRNDRIPDILLLFSKLDGRLDDWRCSQLGTMGEIQSNHRHTNWPSDNSALLNQPCCQIFYHEII